MELPVNREIHELPKQVADKIAAGEVVDRPVSIVKELLENAIDAGASSVTVEIRNGGKTYLRVTDNGCGIDQHQTELAFKRHATSKIQEASDLDSIVTLGFRGEALSSIAAVSRTELITKTAEAESGCKVRIEGGEFVSKTQTGCPEGTTLVISDLFYNTPARMKFLKPDNTESTLIIDFVSRMALAYPRVKIRMINNGNILFSTPGKGDIYTNILTIYSREIGEQLIRTEGQAEGMKLVAYVSPPSKSRTNRKNQIFFVNGRAVGSKVLDAAVTEAYAEKLFEGRHPIVFLFLSVSPERLDVNIHPNKKEVRFDEERIVRSFVAETIRQGLSTEGAVPEIRQENLFKNKDWLPEKTEKQEDKQGQLSIQDTGKETGSKTSGKQSVDIKSFLSNRPHGPNLERPSQGNKTRAGERPAYDWKAESLVPSEPKPPIKESILREEKPAYFEPAPSSPPEMEREMPPLQMPEPPEKKPFNIGGLKPTGAIFNTYITAVDGDSFYLIDQHAAHERIFYEELMEAYNREERHSQMLLTSFVVEMPFAVKNNAADFLRYLEKVGYRLEEFGAKAYVVKEIPSSMELAEAQDFLEYFLDNISADFSLRDEARVNKIIMKSCKSAVKAKDHLDVQEIDALLRSLGKTRNPFSCPHGRPTFIRLTKYEIEKLFKRV